MPVQKLNLSHHDIVVGNEIAEAAFSKELVDQLSRDMWHVHVWTRFPSFKASV